MTSFVTFFFLAFCLVACTQALPSQRVVLGGRDAAPHGWNIEGAAMPEDRVLFIVQLKKSEGVAEWITETVNAVSYPSSPRYGQYLSYEEIAAVVSPPAAHFEAVESWLAAHGIVNAADGSHRVQRYMDAIHVSTNIRAAGALMHTSFLRYRAVRDSSRVVVRQFGDFSVPSELKESIIEHVFGLSEYVSSSSCSFHFLHFLFISLLFFL